jgi:hypothetical protein
MRSKHPTFAQLGAALLVAALGGCHFERNVSDDCWIDRAGFEAATRYRAGLRARNLPADDGSWAVAETRLVQARKALQNCEDGGPGPGRPKLTDLSHGHAGGDGSGAHGAPAGGHGGGAEPPEGAAGAHGA